MDDNSNIIVCNKDNILIGACFVNIYNNGTILWLREIAVRPSYQGKGFGKKLVEKALLYRSEKNAVRGFLAADSLNFSAISLYEKYGFKRADERGQINMIREN